MKRLKGTIKTREGTAGPLADAEHIVLLSIRRYWKNLIGVAIFPPAFFIGSEIFHVPALIFLPFFFLALGFAGWPYLTRRAPYLFWIVALGVWLGAAVFGLITLQITRAFAGSKSAASSSKPDH